MIPRQIFITGSPQHFNNETIKQSIATLRDANPQHTIRLFGDQEQADFIRNTFGESMHQIYQSINPKYPAARKDLWSYLVIYAFGGIYLDHKSTCLRPLDSILNDRQFVLSQWSNMPGEPFENWGLHPGLWMLSGGEIVNWFFACVPRHPMLKQMIQGVLNRIKRYQATPETIGRKGILETTGPIAWSYGFLQSHNNFKASNDFHLINQRDLELVYSVFDDGQTGFHLQHRHQDPNHYSRINEPVVIGKERSR